MASPNRRYFENLVYRTLYPTPDSKDPSCFDDFARKFLIKEVRQENVRYYGREEDRGEEQDALYPGHDYFSTASRTRLGQFPHHRRLFEIFDDLRLTKHDIDLLCTWEGSKSARERFEWEKGYKVPDLSWDHLPPPPMRARPTVIHHDLPIRSKHRKHQRNSVVLSKPHKRDYYEDQNIWGNFNTPPPTLHPRRRNTTLHTGSSSMPTAYYVPRLPATARPPPVYNPQPVNDPLQEWMGIMRRAGTHGVHAPATSSWSTRDILARHPPVIVPARRITRHNDFDADPFRFFDSQPISSSPTQPAVSPQQTNGSNNAQGEEEDIFIIGDSPSPLSTVRHHDSMTNATSEALARTFLGP